MCGEGRLAARAGVTNLSHHHIPPLPTAQHKGVPATGGEARRKEGDCHNR